MRNEIKNSNNYKKKSNQRTPCNASVVHFPVDLLELAEQYVEGGRPIILRLLLKSLVEAVKNVRIFYR